MRRYFMKYLPINILCVIFLSIFSIIIFADDISDKEIWMGPLLKFDDQELAFNEVEVSSGKWKISALYLLKAKDDLDAHENLIIPNNNGNQINKEKVASYFNGDFIKYSIEVTQTEEEQKIQYKLENEPDFWEFAVPALGQSHNILYHSCNGYQSVEAKEAVGGISPAWAIVNQKHQQKYYHLQLAGGDQIYADGYVSENFAEYRPQMPGRDNGVFALPSLKPWFDAIGSDYHASQAKFTKKMGNEIRKFYFAQYIEHYNQPQFRQAMASIPMLAQKDDHDLFDGANSYPGYLKDSYVMQGIHRIGNNFYRIVQHHLPALKRSQRIEKNPINFLKVVNDGQVAILGADTRSLRNQNQIIGRKGYDEIFDLLKELPDSVQHLMVMYAVPVVYASTKHLEGVAGPLFNLPIIGRFALEVTGAKNSFQLFELSDDLRDGWSHKAHLDERNIMIERFQAFAQKRNLRVTFLSGDVHLGGHGVIYPRSSSKYDAGNETIHQIISSPIGNKPVGRFAARLIGQKAKSAQRLSENISMRIVRIREKANVAQKSHHLLNRRNFVSLALLEDSFLQAIWTTEEENNETNEYLFDVPAPDALIDPGAQTKIQHLKARDRTQR